MGNFLVLWAWINLGVMRGKEREGGGERGRKGDEEEGGEAVVLL